MCSLLIFGRSRSQVDPRTISGQPRLVHKITDAIQLRATEAYASLDRWRAMSVNISCGNGFCRPLTRGFLGEDLARRELFMEIFTTHLVMKSYPSPVGRLPLEGKHEGGVRAFCLRPSTWVPSTRPRTCGSPALSTNPLKTPLV
jgi:hypothetical protein